MSGFSPPVSLQCGRISGLRGRNGHGEKADTTETQSETKIILSVCLKLFSEPDGRDVGAWGQLTCTQP